MTVCFGRHKLASAPHRRTEQRLFQFIDKGERLSGAECVGVDPLEAIKSGIVARISRNGVREQWKLCERGHGAAGMSSAI